MIKHFLFSLCLLGLLSNICAQQLEKIEPPFWWVDMNNPSLQVMLYGDNIGDLDITLIETEVELVHTHRPDNQNYLFLDLQIKKGIQPGPFEIQLKKGRNVVSRFQYQLKARSKEQKNAPSISPADAIYLITPDRFANGDKSNDEMEGLREGLLRREEYGRHGGDIQGIQDHLPYIKELGFTAIWLNPVLENDQDEWSYHGYSTTDYFKVDPRFGTNEDYVSM